MTHSMLQCHELKSIKSITGTTRTTGSFENYNFSLPKSMKNLFILIAMTIGFLFAPITTSMPATDAAHSGVQEKLLAKQEMSLENRHAAPSVNSVFSDNILLTIWYMSGKVKKSSDIRWDEIRKPFTYTMVLKPGETFAFHDDVLPEYKDSVVKTTNSHFGPEQGFLTDGYLYGDGVCHLASVMNWAATSAGLKVDARVRHDFALVPGIARQYGTSIYDTTGASHNDQMQNLYITNNQETDVYIEFISSGKNLAVKILKK